jgi:hypothetical protein
MAIIKWLGTHVTTLSFDSMDWPYFDIHDWRMMKYGKIYSKKHGRDELCVLISAKENIRVIPHTTILELMDYNARGKQFEVTKYHFAYKVSKEGMAYCWRCKGAGKFDWIQKTSPERMLRWGDAPKSFVRDESCHYIYPNFDNYIFARVAIQPGETRCEKCEGFGILLDGRFGALKGMKDIKKKLIKIETI